MGAHSRNKGANGERELLRWFSTNFELPRLTRNLMQTREGGADCLDIPGIALEVKRQETLCVDTWWKQTVDQAIRVNRLPVLAYRQNRRRWHFCLPASLITPGSWGYITVTEQEFRYWFTHRYILDTENA